MGPSNKLQKSIGLWVQEDGMAFAIRVRPLLLMFVLPFALFVSDTAHAASSRAAKGPGDYRVGSRVKLVLNDHTSVRGTVSAVHEDSIDVLTKGTTTPRTLAFANISSSREITPLGSRFQMGPCVGPVTLAIASPFILVAALFGH
jgi:hypothetical protein